MDQLRITEGFVVHNMFNAIDSAVISLIALRLGASTVILAKDCSYTPLVVAIPVIGKGDRLITPGSFGVPLVDKRSHLLSAAGEFALLYHVRV